MPSLWIVHRDSRARAALARLVGAGEDCVLGSPGDRHFESLDAPDLVLLGLAADLELELEFAHRFAARLPASRWLLVADPRDVHEATRLFDAVATDVLPYPPSSHALRRRVHTLLTRRRVDSLSARRARDAVADRFSRYFADLDLPELLRALDPRLAEVPLLVQGEAGTGRGLLVRYIHAFGGTTGGAFASVSCQGIDDAAALRRAFTEGCVAEGASSALTVCFDAVDQLPIALQREVASWIELSPPGPLARAARLRFVATAGDPQWEQATESAELDASLSAALSGLCLRIPPLRERASAVPGFVDATARAWSGERGEQPRSFSAEALDALTSYPWPGNLRELEAVVVRTLAQTSTDPIQPEHLRFDALPLEPPVEAPFQSLSPQLTETEGDVIGEVEAVPEPHEVAAASAGPELEVVAELRDSEVAEAAEPASREPAAEELKADFDAALRKLAGALAHEVRNPLVAIRVFAELLPERFRDEEFRERFARSVKSDVERLEAVVSRVARLAGDSAAGHLAVDVSSLLDELLEGQREDLEGRRVLVLKELERTRPFAQSDPARLRVAIEGILEKALSMVPQGGDAYVASKHHASGLRSGPALRILLRFQGGAAKGEGDDGPTTLDVDLDFVLCEALVAAQGGRFQVDAGDEETLVVIDLPAPGNE